MRAEAPCQALRPSGGRHLPVLRARLLPRPRRSPERRPGDMQPPAVPAEARRPGEAPALQGLRPAAKRRASLWRAGLPGHAHRTVLALPGLLLRPPPGQPRHAGARRTGVGAAPGFHVRALLATSAPLVSTLTHLDNSLFGCIIGSAVDPAPLRICSCWSRVRQWASAARPLRPRRCRAGAPRGWLLSDRQDAPAEDVSCVGVPGARRCPTLEIAVSGPPVFP